MRQKRNVVMHGASGALGEQLVFRQRAGKTVISLPAEFEAEPTDKQQAVRIKFKEATRYARIILALPDVKEAYQAKAGPGVSAYNVALADFFKAPVVTEIDVSNYSGSPGDTIRVLATDNFKVEAVRVSILNAAGAVVEEGAAIAAPEGNDTWIYTATIANTAPAGGKVSVEASDLPGNSTTAEQVL
jgi:hypothetical protein